MHMQIACRTDRKECRTKHCSIDVGKQASQTGIEYALAITMPTIREGAGIMNKIGDTLMNSIMYTVIDTVVSMLPHKLVYPLTYTLID